MVVILINLDKFEKKFWVNCPFSLEKPYEELHHKRRCELYNIYYNSRYSYQYICSYSAEEDFKTEYHRSARKRVKGLKILREEIKPEFVLCVEAKNSIKDNIIVEEFLNEYKDNKNYYCSRTDKPKKFEEIYSEKDCNNTAQRNGFWTLFGFNIFSLITYPILCFFLYKFLKKRHEYGDFYWNCFNFRGRNGPELSIPRDTNYSENAIDNLEYIRIKTKNIIFVNKKEYEINTNIKNIIDDKINQQRNLNILKPGINININLELKNEIANSREQINK